MAILPPGGDTVRIFRFLGEHPEWSAYWDKRFGVWRVAEDDPDSDLYVESSDADVVIGYIVAHSWGQEGC
jgi:hypothetical protein